MTPSESAGMPSEAPTFSPGAIRRYARQVVLPEWGLAAQKKVAAAKVLVVGAGGLGSPAAIYLAAAGVGTIGIVDGDIVELSNLHRQILHTTEDIGRPKTASARDHLTAWNPEVEVIEHRVTLTAANALQVVAPYDVIVNGSDNFPTRYLVNDAAVLSRKPLVDAAILRFEGQLAVFVPGHGCYRCLFPTPPPPGSVPSCREAGILGAVAGVLGTLQAVETLKILTGVGEVATGRLMLYDALSATWRTARWSRNPECPVCGDRPRITELIDYEAFCGVPVESPEGGDVPVVAPDDAWEWVRSGQATLIDVRTADEFAEGHIPGAAPLRGDDPSVWAAAIPAGRRALLVCPLGIRSAAVARTLRDWGVDAYSIDGGLVAWAERGLPWEGAAPPF
jgi:molybdopterin/thiamine biosynthesis adenylyltransferase/rhodanese-related sulfurtransferase